MNYENCLDDLNKLILLEDIYNLFDERERRLLKSSIGLMNFHIYQMSSDEIIDDNYDSKIVDSLLIITDKFLKSSISKNFVLFVKLFSETVYNWNQNYKKDDVLSRLCLLLNRFATLYDSSIMMFKKSRSLLSTFIELNSYIPPSFDLNKKLLEELLQEE